MKLAAAVTLAVALAALLPGAAPAHAAPPWKTATPILDSAPCAGADDVAQLHARAPFTIADELTKSGLAAQANALSPSLEEIFPHERIALLQRASAEGRCRRVHYRVDGLRVTGFLLEPAGARPRSLPAILYARGGNREFGKIDFGTLTLLQTLADAGFVVAATQYRGNDGGEGKEQFGGDDVRDLEALAALVDNVAAYDRTRAYLYGHSRRGMEAYEALRDGLPARAAAVSGGLADLANAIQKRPEMERVAAELVPDWATARQAATEKRSALRWVDRLNVPLLIVHAKQDWRVPVGQALAMDATLSRLGRPHKLLVVDPDAHQIFLHRQALVEALVAWFRAH